MNRNLYRDAAVKQLTSPEQLDQRMKLTRRREWLALAAAGILVLALIVWGVMGRVETKAAGSAIVIRDGGAIHITSSEPGRMADFEVGPNDIVDPGQTIATFSRPDGSTGTLVNPFDERLQILEIQLDDDEAFVDGQALLMAEYIDRPLYALVYLPSITGKQVSPGMDAHLMLGTYSSQNYGYLEGTVETVAPFPATQTGMLTTLNEPEMVQSILAQTGAGPIAVHIRLTEDPRTPSGYRWSSSSGPQTELTTGLIGQAEIVIDEQPPIALVVP